MDLFGQGIEDIRVVPVCGVVTTLALTIFALIAVPVSFKSMEQGRYSVMLHWMTQEISKEVRERELC